MSKKPDSTIPAVAPLDMAPEKESVTLQALPYAMGVVAGVTTGAARVWKEFYDEVKNYPAVKLMRQARDKGLNDATSHKGADRKVVAKAVQDVNKKFSSELGIYLKEHMGIQSNSWADGIRGTFERIPHIKPNKMAEIVFTTAGSMAVTVGALLIIAQTRHLKHSNTRQDENLRDLARRIDAQDAHRNQDAQASR